MTLTDARTTLCLKLDDDLLGHLSECRQARNQIAELTENAKNPNLAKIYQRSLDQLDQALATIQEHLQASVLAAPNLPSQLSEKIPAVAPESPLSEVVATSQAPINGMARPTPTTRLEPTPTLGKISPPPATSVPSAPEAAAQPVRSSGVASFFAWFFIFLIGASGGAWLYWQNETSRKQQLQTRIAFLERMGSIAVENRDWPAATRAFQEIETKQPGSEIAQIGRRSIEAGMNEEQTQFIGYWTGQASAELEAGRLDDAAAATEQVLKKYPNHTEILAIAERIDHQRATLFRTQLLAQARTQIDNRKLQEAVATVKKILAAIPGDADATSLLADANAAIEKATQNKLKAAALYQKARTREQGQFDQQAFDWLREANSLDPTNQEISSLLEKLASYTRTVRVPEDTPSLTEALASARDRDRILLAPGTWQGPISINVTLDLQGTDPTKTTIECAPEEGSAITLGPAAKGARISGITFRHRSFAAGEDRYSVALVRGSNGTFIDCRFADGSGHGLAVIESGHALIERCRFSENGWNGIAVNGVGSTLEVKDSEAINNFENGIESWNGAAIILTNNRCEANSRNGIHIDNGAASASLTGNQLIANREFGLVLTSAGSGNIMANISRNNLLGGIVIRAASGSLPFTKNQAIANQGSGLIIESGLTPSSYAENSVSKNAEPQVLFSSELSGQEPEVPAADVTVPGQTPEP